jgi:hypothetical protein
MTPMKAAVTDTDGTRKVYSVKPLDKITVREWVNITSPPIAETLVERYDILLEFLQRHTKIPKSALERMPASEAYKLLETMEKVMVEAAEARAKSSTGQPPKFFVHKGETFVVPQDPENEMTFGQAESLEKVLLPACATDSEGYAAILAVMCLKEDETFTTTILKERMELFMDLPVLIAFDICAFFFGCSERLRRSTLRIVGLSQNSERLRNALELRSTSKPMDHSLTLDAPPN